MPHLFKVSCIFVLLLIFAADVSAHMNTSEYRAMNVEGFDLFISPEVDKHPEVKATLFTEIDKQLRYVSDMVPPIALALLQEVPIWVEWTDERFPRSVYHISGQWLSENGYNPDKAGSIQISNANTFIASSQSDVTVVLLHEFSHAYFYKVLGADHPGIASAYENAKNTGLYKSVPYYKGYHAEAYALKDKSEYFAEISEAYFGKNDYYPFTKKELSEYDPVAYQLMSEVW